MCLSLSVLRPDILNPRSWTYSLLLAIAVGDGKEPSSSSVGAKHTLNLNHLSSPITSVFLRDYLWHHGFKWISFLTLCDVWINTDVMKEGREYRGGTTLSMVQIQRRSVVLEKWELRPEELAISTNQEEYAQSLRWGSTRLGHASHQTQWGPRIMGIGWNKIKGRPSELVDWQGELGDQ